MTRALTADEVLALLTDSNPKKAAGQIWQDDEYHAALLLLRKGKRVHVIVKAHSGCSIKQKSVFQHWSSLLPTSKFIGVGEYNGPKLDS